MVSEEKQYEFFTRQIAERTNMAFVLFRYFGQLFSAIVGGAIWLRIELDASLPEVRASMALQAYQHLSNALVLTVAAVSVGVIWHNYYSWWRYRMSLTKFEVEGPPIHPPAILSSCWSHLIITAALLVLSILFVAWNPFTI